MFYVRYCSSSQAAQWKSQGTIQSKNKFIQFFEFRVNRHSQAVEKRKAKSYWKQWLLQIHIGFWGWTTTFAPRLLYTNYSLFLRYELDENLTNIAEKQHAEILSELRRVLFLDSVNFITARGVDLFLMKRIWVLLAVKLQKPRN